MKAMLIAAGRGTRLRPLTDSTPKCMLQFQGKPLLAHWLDKLRVIGITEVVINVHHLADQIMNYFGTGEQWGLNIRYSPEKDLLGTAGAVRQARSILDGERFVAIYADNQSTCDLNEIVEFHASHCSIATMSACWIEDPRSCGIVGFDESGRIERFLEKPTSEQIFSHYINAGIYVFEPEIFEYIPAEGECDFSRDVFPAMLVRKAPLYAYSYNGYVLKFDTFEDWKRSEAIVRDHELAGKPGTQVTV
jgi:mannose-1-phosphate guanylyltransferase / phosphomannomutase